MSTVLTSPVGALMVEAERAARKKKTDQRHLSQAVCGCTVRVVCYGPGTCAYKTTRCVEHAFKRDPKTGRAI